MPFWNSVSFPGSASVALVATTTSDYSQPGRIYRSGKSKVAWKKFSGELGNRRKVEETGKEYEEYPVK